MDNRFDDVASRVGDNMSVMRDELAQRAEEIRAAVHDYVDRQPLVSVGVAFGIGYLLSGALFSRATMRVARFGGRFFLGNALRQLALGAGSGLLASALGERPVVGRTGGNQGETH